MTPELVGKKIILAVSGSIAAYKSVILLRLLQKAGAEVQVILTNNAKEFVGELSFSSLSNYPIHSQLSLDQEWTNHVHLGAWADLFLVAPATAQTISKLANGMVDNLLTAVYLSAKCPVMIAPAMDLDMWNHPATQKNISTLETYGVNFIPVGDGPLASGLVGPGRLAEPIEILNFVTSFFTKGQFLKNKNILVTAGPTYEAIDPVRFIGNHSSGKMGIRIAEKAAELGADVELILGPSSVKIKEYQNLKVTRIESADDMFLEVKKLQPKMEVFIFAAAVADYKIEYIAKEKIKKSSEQLQINLVPTPDIAAYIGQNKTAAQFVVGFALETENILEHARQKMDKKNMDMVVINSAKEKGSAFYVDTNKIQILHKSGVLLEYPQKSKEKVAEDILLEMLTKLT